MEVAKNFGRRVTIQPKKSASFAKEKAKPSNTRETKPKRISLKASSPQFKGTTSARRQTFTDTKRKSSRENHATTSKSLTKASKSLPKASVKQDRKKTSSRPKSVSRSRTTDASPQDKKHSQSSEIRTPKNSYGISFSKLAKELPPKQFERSLVVAFNPVKEVSEAEEKYLEGVFRKPATFIQSATRMNQLENTELPEVAFIGRSNVGKSSLINALVNRNKLVKTSSKPGHTKLLNFFKVSDRLVLTDMPGYGHGCRDDWRRMIWGYFKDRTLLRRVFLLVNCEHSLKSSDKELIGVLEKLAVPYQIVLTKQDKAKQTEISTTKRQVQSYLLNKIKTRVCLPELISVSARKKRGINELRRSVLEAVEIHP